MFEIDENTLRPRIYLRNPELTSREHDSWFKDNATNENERHGRRRRPKARKSLIEKFNRR